MATMLIGVPKEIKVHEYRVGMTPSSVREAVAHGHPVIVETMAGAGIGAADDDYRRAGADVVGSAAEVFKRADMVVKVKEPQAVERKQLRAGQVLFTYLHLAPDPEQAKDLVATGAICIAYETVTSPTGGLPLLAPMSEVAGRLAVQAGAHCLESPPAAWACCSAASRASHRRESLSWAPVSSARIPRRWRSVQAPKS
jgi:alanine dehydrogenase